MDNDPVHPQLLVFEVYHCFILLVLNLCSWCIIFKCLTNSFTTYIICVSVKLK